MIYTSMPLTQLERMLMAAFDAGRDRERVSSSSDFPTEGEAEEYASSVIEVLPVDPPVKVETCVCSRPPGGSVVYQGEDVVRCPSCLKPKP